MKKTDFCERIAYEINQSLPRSYQDEILKAQVALMESLAKKNLTERKILLVGGAGYVGSVMARHLIECGYKVRIADNFTYLNDQSIVSLLNHPHFEFQNCDITSGEQLDKALKGISDVVLLAGLVGDPITKKYPQESESANLQGIKSVIDKSHANKIERLVFISTCSNYGLIPENILADEGYELNPLSLYSKAKVSIETHLLNNKENWNFKFTILRFATAFGLSPRMRFDLTVNEFTRELFLNHDLLVFDAHTWRPYCHVKDFSLAVRRVLEAPENRVAGQVFNTGGDKNNFTKQMIVDEVQKYFPKAKVGYQAQGSDPRNYKVNFGKIKEILHFNPEYTVQDGIKELAVALNNGFFSQVDANKNYYGNYQIFTSKK